MLATAPPAILGRSRPRIGPPAPLRHDMAGLRAVAADIGIVFMPWQEVSATYTEALAADDRHLFQEVCEVASRQNGKTEKIVAIIVKRLRQGRRIIHTAQNRELPREVFGRVADVMMSRYPGELRSKPRFANGQEEIRMRNGGRYRIVAPTRGGARGGANDDVIVDELRELESLEFIAAVKPTMTASPDPQILYYSNAGTDDSIVLNSIKGRAGLDPRLAYLEWSSAPERDDGDLEGWLEANPAIGYLPTMLEYLQGEYVSNKLGGTLAIFETEHLCRWVPTMRPRLVDEFAWGRAFAVKPFGRPSRPSIGIGYDPQAGRASVVAAWREDDKHVALRELFDVAVDETGITELGADALKMARRLGVQNVGYDDATDRDLARQFTGTLAKKTKPVIGKDFANATEAFVRGIESGTLRWQDGEHITADLKATSRKENDEAGTFHAVKSKDDVPITAALAAIRAYWLASASRPSSLQVR